MIIIILLNNHLNEILHIKLAKLNLEFCLSVLSQRPICIIVRPGGVIRIVKTSERINKKGKFYKEIIYCIKGFICKHYKVMVSSFILSVIITTATSNQSGTSDTL